MDEIDLYDWAAYKFGYEYRLVGYMFSADRGTMRCIISDPVTNVYKDKELVETSNGIKYKMHEPIKVERKIDMMYSLDRWLNLQNKGPGTEVTNAILESLGRIKE